MKPTTYFSVFEPCDDGYSVYFPDLPGCISIGSDIKEAEKNAEEALGLHLWGMEEDKLLYSSHYRIYGACEK